MDKVKGDFVFSRDGGGSIVNTHDHSKWTYLGVGGLCPIDRWTHARFEPVAKLSKKQMARLCSHVEKSTEHVVKPNSCFIQLVTNPRNLCVDSQSIKEKVKRNYKKTLPLHAYVRLIDSNGKVYSTGFGSTQEEDEKQAKMGYFSTINGMPTILDYEEFRPHEGRITTTYAISKKKLDKTLSIIQRDRTNTIRFNIISQNCNTLALRYLSIAGVKFGSIRMRAKDVLYSMLPNKPFTLPVYFPKLLRCIVKKVVELFIQTILHPLSVLLINPILILHCGWNRGSPIAERKGLSKPSDMPDLFSGRLAWYENAFDKEIDFSLKTVEKQLSTKTGSTWVHNYKDKPSMSVVPPSGKRERKLDQKYLEDLKNLYLHRSLKGKKMQTMKSIALPA